MDNRLASSSKAHPRPPRRSRLATDFWTQPPVASAVDVPEVSATVSEPAEEEQRVRPAQD